MPLKGILFIGLFLLCAGGALVLPCLGVYGYVADYCIGPARQWWEAPFSGLGIRYSYVLALATAIGMLIHWRKLRFGERLIQSQEALVLMFLGIVCLFAFMGEQTIGRYTIVDHPSIKFTKVVVFLLMMTHIITDIRKLNVLFWVFVIGSLLLGIQAWDLPRSAFLRGRLEGIGGADFQDANRFGGFMAGMLFIISVKFIRSKWWGKCVCFIAGGFAANAVILTRSRGAMLGIAGGMFVAALLAPKQYRIKIFVGLILVGLGIFYLSDPQTLYRASTITANEEQRDHSMQSRLEIWQGGIKMILDRPLFGVGPGNFYQYIGNYQPDHPGRDAHNTFIRCAGELGIPGLILLVLIVGNAARILLGCIRKSPKLPPGVGKDVLWMSFGCLTCLTAMLTYGMTGTLAYTEYLWWMLTLPVCMQRVLENELADMNIAAQQKEEAESTAALESKAETLPNRRSQKNRYAL